MHNSAYVNKVLTVIYLLISLSLLDIMKKSIYCKISIKLIKLKYNLIRNTEDMTYMAVRTTCACFCIEQAVILINGVRNMGMKEPDDSR